MTREEIEIGGKYECMVNGRKIVIKVLSVKEFGIGGIKITFQDATRPGRKMERYSSHDFRKVS